MEEERVVEEEVSMEEEWVVEEEWVPPPKPPDGKACTCWFATKGPDPNSTITAAIAAILKLIPVFEFINKLRD